MTTEEKKRTWTKVTPEMEISVFNARERLGLTASQSDIADVVGLTKYQVKYIETDLPRLRRAKSGEAAASRSLRSRILEVLTQMDRVDSVPEMRRILGTADDEHNIVHVLTALNQQGEVNYTRFDGGRQFRDIRIHKAKRRNGERSPALTEAMAVEVPEPEVTAEPAREETANVTSVVPLPEPEPDQYPVLERLRARQREAVEAEAIAAKYVAAAELLGEVDPSMADRLMDEAAAVSISLTAEHLEYLRYAEEHSQHNDEFDR